MATQVTLQARPILRVSAPSRPQQDSTPRPQNVASTPDQLPQTGLAPQAQHGSSQLRSVAVVTAVTRLLLDRAWPNPQCEELDALVRVVTQFLSGVSSTLLPSSKWRDHRLWGHLRGMGDFAYLEELVRDAVIKFQKIKKPRTM